MKKVFTFLQAIVFLLLWNGAAAQYCTPVYSYGCWDGDGVVQFTLGTINQSISCSGTIPYYHYFSDDNTVMQTGVNYTVTIQAGYSSTYVKIWIDLNHNNTFDPATETMASIICYNSYTNYSATINIPNSGTLSGTTMLRAMTEYYGYPAGPCSTSEVYGNCNDFPVTITPYCIPSYSTGCTFGDGLTQFALNTINQPVSCTTTPLAYYHDWTNTPAGTTSLYSGTPYTMTVTAGYSMTDVRVWMDLDNNKVFDQPGEILVSDFVCTNLGTPYSTLLTIPAGTSVGNHTLRFRTSWASTPSDPCSSLTFGNAGDFTVNVLPSPPVATTNAATGIAPDGAIVNGTVNPNLYSTTVAFHYGLTTSYGTTVPGVPPVLTGTTDQPVSASVNGLAAGTLYHYQVVATNANGTTNGNDMTFTTLYIPPDVTTTAATNVAAYTAVINGTVTANNLSSTVSFEYGTTTAYGTTLPATPGTVNGMTPVNVSVDLNGLDLNVTYHYRVDATNAAGTTYGDDMTFTTFCPVVGSPGTITGDAAVCQGTSGHVYSCDAITNALAYMWSVPPGATITAGANTNSITVSYDNTATSGNISVYGTNICSNGPTSTLPVTVNTPPILSIGGPTLPCQGVNYPYTTQTGQNGYIWTVSGGGQIISGQGTDNLIVKWNDTGAQNVSVNFANANGCYAFSPIVLDVTVQPAPVPTISGLTQMCVNSGFYYYNTEAGKSSYTWTISSGGTIIFGQGTNQIQVTWDQPGSQYVTVNYATAAGCFAIEPATYNVTVDPYPDPVGSISGTSSVCAGAMGIAYSVEPVNNAETYVWSLPAGATIASGEGTNSITVDFSAGASSGNISVYGNNLCGNGTVSPPFAVTVNTVPPVPGNILGPISVCEGTQGVIYSILPVAGTETYTWTVPLGAEIVAGAGTTSITVNFSKSASSGMITVYGTNSCGSGDSSSLAITLIPLPAAPVISIVDTTLYSNAPAGNQWYLDGSLLPGASKQDYIPLATGMYWDIVTLNGCSSDTSNNIYYVMLGVATVAGNSFIIYPVPNDGNFNLAIHAAISANYTLEVYNNLGIQVYRVKNIFVNGSAVIQVDMRPVPSGIYTAVLRDSNNEVIKKFLVNR